MAEQTDAKQPRVERPVVAELGRPETPQETAARKAETTRTHRASQTVINLVGAVIACLAVVFVLVLVVVRPAPEPPDPIDYQTVASQAQVNAEVPLIAPEVPADWYANSARLETVGGVQTWYIGLITGSEGFIALNQGIEANPTWQSNLLEGQQPTGESTIAGLDWELYDSRDLSDAGNLAFAMTTSIDGSVIVLYGTASDEEFELVASSIAGELQ